MEKYNTIIGYKPYKDNTHINLRHILKNIGSVSINRDYSYEDICAILIYEAKYMHGWQCRYCNNTTYTYLTNYYKYRCKVCKAQTSLLSGTVFTNSKLDYVKMIKLIWYIVKFQFLTDKNISRKAKVSIKTVKRYRSLVLSGSNSERSEELDNEW